MDYEGRICRSPFERGAFMLPVMVGCTWNKCKFCGLFKHLKFRVLPFEQVKAEIDRVADGGGNPEVVFLGDGNAFSLNAHQLLEICNYVTEKFPACKEINMDSTITAIAAKTDEELAQLHEAKVNGLYIGIECALDDVLEYMDKDHNMAEAREQIARIKAVGMEFDAHIMSGVCGEGRGVENAHALAAFFNEFQPQNICNFDMFLHTNHELGEDYKKGIFKPSDAIEKFRECRTLLEEMKPAEGTTINYDGIFEVPPVRFKATLPQDREKILNYIDATIEKYKDEPPMYCVVS